MGRCPNVSALSGQINTAWCDWRSKNERLLWVADAIAGAVGEYVAGQSSEWFAILEKANAIELVNRQI